MPNKSSKPPAQPSALGFGTWSSGGCRHGSGVRRPTIDICSA